MEKTINKIIEYTFNKTYIIGKSRNSKVKLLDIIAFIAISLIGFLIRKQFFLFESNDYLGFLNNWVEHFRVEGFRGIADGLYDYTPTYMYGLYLVSIFPIKRILGIKLISVTFDYILALTMGAIVISECSDKKTKDLGNGLLPYGFVLLMPTVISNSSMWGQCDAIYTSFILLTILFIIKNKSDIAMLMYGIAFCLKLQSIFFMPVLILLWLCKRINLKSFLYIPMIYFISIIPAWIAGRPLSELLMIYFKQAKSGSLLTLKWPNVYYLLGEDMFVEMYGKAAIWFTFGVLFIVFFFLLKICYKIGISDKLLVSISLLCVMLVTYFLPFMHERYGFIADILCVLYAINYRNKFYVPILHIGISFLAYTRYYTKGLQEQIVPMEVLAVLLLLLIADVGYTLYKQLNELEGSKENDKLT
ncbi:MAG: hypothetical protein PHQ65_07285 [Bacteroidales bacterium]|nr:hypothetical protein [Bacteroidales bacterium]